MDYPLKVFIRAARIQVKYVPFPGASGDKHQPANERSKESNSLRFPSMHSNSA
jgi:hypothetical protein